MIAFPLESYRLLCEGYGKGGVVAAKMASGECFDVRAVDPAIHHEILGTAAIALNLPLRIDLHGEPCWGIVMYLGADALNVNRHPILKCFDSDGQPTGGDLARGTFGAGTFQYLYYQVMRFPFPGWPEPRPIAYCTIDPGLPNDGVFLSQIGIQAD